MILTVNPAIGARMGGWFATPLAILTPAVIMVVLLVVNLLVPKDPEYQLLGGIIGVVLSLTTVGIISAAAGKKIGLLLSSTAQCHVASLISQSLLIAFVVWMFLEPGPNREGGNADVIRLTNIIMQIAFLLFIVLGYISFYVYAVKSANTRKPRQA
jgi:hypothetical protein